MCSPWQAPLESKIALLPFPRAALGTACLWGLGGPFISEPCSSVSGRCQDTQMFCVWGRITEAALWTDVMLTQTFMQVALPTGWPLPASWVWSDSCVSYFLAFLSPTRRKAGKAQGSGNLIWDPISIWLLIRGEEESRKPNHLLERHGKSRETVKQALSLLGDHPGHLGCLGARRLARVLLSLFGFPPS